MVENIIIPLAALIASVLSFYSGFGLGTLLMPALAVFFPLPAAIAATALVHGANNLFKLMLVGAKAEKELVVEFGLPAIAAAFAGAWTLHFFAAVSGGHSYSYVLLGKIAVITPLKALLAVLMMAFALLDLHPRLKGLKFDRRYLALGGLLSGFFGGLSGHQGALRSAFLIKVDVQPQSFVATNAVIGFMVDFARLLTYAFTFFVLGDPGGSGAVPVTTVALAAGASVLGVLAGLRFLHKVTIGAVQIITGVMLGIIAVALGMGLI
ncbi:MAG: TSUP family transporter [Elusimicrobia bacterium]|nr:TSUP family transporter [Elusimicrobiota bacterium]